MLTKMERDAKHKEKMAYKKALRRNLQDSVNEYRAKAEHRKGQHIRVNTKTLDRIKARS